MGSPAATQFVFSALSDKEIAAIADILCSCLDSSKSPGGARRRRVRLSVFRFLSACGVVDGFRSEAVLRVRGPPHT